MTQGVQSAIHCKACGEPFTPLPWQVKHGRRKCPACCRAASKIGRKFEQPHARFWSKVDLSEVGPWDCWEWGGHRRRNYGQFNIPRGDGSGKWVMVQAHRHAYFLTYGPFTEPVIRHRCDNRGCVNPMHLIAGTKGDNLVDAYNRGQKKPSHGSSCGTAKINEEQAMAIMRDKRPSREIAPEYGLNRNTITRIRNGKCWKRVRAWIEAEEGVKP